LPNVVPKPTPVLRKIISGSIKMIFLAPFHQSSLLSKSKFPNHHPKKSSESRSEKLSSTQNPPKILKSANLNKLHLKGSSLNISSEPKPKTFPKITEKLS